jgi:hypothetical protein
LHTAGRICDILYTPNNQNLRGVNPILADVFQTRPFIGNAVDRDRCATYQEKKLSQRAQFKNVKHAWENVHVVVPFVSDTLGFMSGESVDTLCLVAWCRAEREAEFFVEDWGGGAGTDNGASALAEASRRASCRWDARLTLAVW